MCHSRQYTLNITGVIFCAGPGYRLATTQERQFLGRTNVYDYRTPGSAGMMTVELAQSVAERYVGENAAILQALQALKRPLALKPAQPRGMLQSSLAGETTTHLSRILLQLGGHEATPMKNQAP